MRTSSRLLLLVALVPTFLIVGALVAARAGVQVLAPVELSFHYPWSGLADQATTMNRCLGCHETEDLHTCATCHDEHGGIEMSEVPFNDLLLLGGDVPDPGYIRINDILPYRDQPDTSIGLVDFLEHHDAANFESVTLASQDGAYVSVAKSELTEEARLLPHMDGIRFAAPNLHISAWLKGVWRIIVVGTEKPLTVDGELTSIGRLLLGPTRLVTVEQANVMLQSEEDGQIRHAQTASRVEGAAIEQLVATPGFSQLLVRDGSGKEYVVAAEDATDAVVTQMWDQVVLVLPLRGRGLWVRDVVEIRSQK